MCGILGFIGKSRNPRVSFDLANALFLKTEHRGEHATGFWACERGSGSVFYDKEPVKSSIYVTRDIWRKQFANIDADLFIGHCRQTSPNSGHEKFNKNNHPHASKDHNIALVHNGKIPEYYSPLRNRYDLRSDCDSEILLAMFESGEHQKDKAELLNKEFPNWSPEITYRMQGLKELFSRVNYGHMAVAIGERSKITEGGRFLWLFREEERPLHVIDMRRSLGQIFFCSLPDIWKQAVESCPSVKEYITSRDQPLIDFPPHNVWMLSLIPNQDPEAKAWEYLKVVEEPVGTKKYIDKESVPENVWCDAVSLAADAWRLKKFKIAKSRFAEWKPEDDQGVRLPRLNGKSGVKVISRLDGDDDVGVSKEPVATECKVKAPASKKVVVNRDAEVSDEVSTMNVPSSVSETLTKMSAKEAASEVITMKDFDDGLTKLRDIITQFECRVRNMDRENSLQQKELQVIMDSVQDARMEIEGSLAFLKL